MILKEFALFTERDREERMRFHFETRCVTSHFERLFPKFKTDKSWKVLIWCVDDLKGRDVVIGPVTQVFLPVDVSPFFHLPDQQKKRWAFNQLKNGLTFLLERTQWYSDPFLSTLDSLEMTGFDNNWVWQKKSSPSRKHAIEIVINMDVEHCSIWALVTDSSGELILKKKLVSTKPNEILFVPYLGKLSWASSTCALLKHRYDDSQFEICIPTPKCG